MNGPQGESRRRASLPVHSARVPKAIGPYAQARRVPAGDLEWLYTSGQVGLDPASGELVPGGTPTEARQALANLRAVLAEAGCDFHDVVKTTIYLADMADFQAVNQIYAEALGGALPARSTVQAAALPKGARVEIDLVCVRSRS
jgi:2-iminobutanoate/2-iminopropanoate deaminase